MVKTSKSKDYSSAQGPWHYHFFGTHFETPEQIRPLLWFILATYRRDLLDLDSITVRKGNLPDAAELKEYLSDLIVDIPLKSGERVVISVLIEHKSGADPGLMRQLLTYMARLYAKDALAVLPVTIYHGRLQWKREKTFHAFQHEGLPGEFLDAFGDYLIDFRTIFVNLGDEEVRRRMAELPLRERLALQAMADIWEADQDTYSDWMEQTAPLPKSEREDFIRSYHKYFTNTHRSVTMGELEQALQTKRSGARTMPEREQLEEIMRQWKGVMPQSVAEAEARGNKIGEERGAHKAACEMAERLIRDGKSDLEVQRYTKLSTEEIEQMRNGG